MGTTEHHDLIENFINGDSRSFTRLYEHLAPFLLALARKFTDDQLAAEEVVQDAFISLFDRRTTLKAENGLASIKAYMATSVRNNAFNLRRSQSSKKAIIRDINDSLPVFEDPNVFRAELEAECFNRMRAKIAALPPAERRVFELVIVEAMTPEEASEVLKISKKRIDNMRATINGLLKPKLSAVAGAVSLAAVIIRWVTEKL